MMVCTRVCFSPIQIYQHSYQFMEKWIYPDLGFTQVKDGSKIEAI